MNPLKLFFFLLSITLIISQNISAQDRITFGYDLAGNRISRVIPMQSFASIASDSTFVAMEEQITEGSLNPEKIEEKVESEEEFTEEEESLIYSERVNEMEILIYPNPTKGLIRIEFLKLPEDTEATLYLYDMAGKLIAVKEKVTDYTEIDITDEPDGIYILKIIAGEEQTEWKIIKK